jgi:chromosome segregation ATPase
MPHSSHLRPLLADHPFQETYKHLRDLRFVAVLLGGWQDKLGTYGAMLEERRAAFAVRLPKVRESAGAVNLPALDSRRAALAAELAEAERQADGVALADAAEQALLERLRRSRSVLAAAAAAPSDAGLAPADVAQLAERLRRAEGALTWQLAQRAPERGWSVKKGLRDSARELDEARTRDAALLRAQAEEPARHERFAARIAALGERIRALQPQVAALEAESGQTLAALAVAELQGQQERLRVYTAQAQLAIAQILDRAQLAQRSERLTGTPR